MRLSDQIKYAIDDADAGKPESALLHACIGIDSTSKRLFPHSTQVGVRFVNTIRNYYWILETLVGSGFDLTQTRFSNIIIKNNREPDIADIIYEIFRCNHAHGAEVPETFSLTKSSGVFNSEWLFGPNELHIPDRIIWALLAISVFAKVNKNQNTNSEHYLSLGNEIFPIRDWWGREDDFRLIADRCNRVKIKIERLDRLLENQNKPERKIANVIVLNPTF